MHYTYVIECSDGTLYTGYTTDVRRRVEEHNSGEGAKYTRGRTPVRLVYTEEFKGRGEAMSREAEIKSMSRNEKEELVGTDELGTKDE
jgi:putative endonuclease